MSRIVTWGVHDTWNPMLSNDHAALPGACVFVLASCATLRGWRPSTSWAIWFIKWQCWGKLILTVNYLGPFWVMLWTGLQADRSTKRERERKREFSSSRNECSMISEKVGVTGDNYVIEKRWVSFTSYSMNTDVSQKLYQITHRRLRNAYRSVII